MSRRTAFRQVLHELSVAQVQTLLRLEGSTLPTTQ